MKNTLAIIKLAKPQHKFIAIAGFLIVIQAVLQQLSPITLKLVVDELSLQVQSGTGDFNRILLLFGFLLAIGLSILVLTAISERLGDYIASRLGKYLTERFYQKIFTLPQQHFDSELSGKIINQLQRGIASIQGFIGTGTNFILPAFLQALFGIGILSYFDWKIGLLAAAVFPLYLIISHYSTKKWGELQKEKNVFEDSARGRIQEVIGSIKLVKTYNTQQQEWDYVSDTYTKINTLYDKQSTMYHALNFLRGFGLEIVFIGILFMVFRGSFIGSFSLGEMVLIIQLLNQLRWPLYGMSYILEQVQRAEADSKAFFEVLELESTENTTKKKLPALIQHPTIEFNSVNFSYDTTPVLKDVTLKFNKNESVALVGHSGAGKTTLLNLILKLYEPKSGEILLSGKEYSKQSHAWVREHVALVFQDTELFSSTIRENVAYGSPNVSDAQIWKALKQANADGFVTQFPDKLDAQIGERGVKLSGGQKQRIQIARAILRDKPILILDEATSSLDSKSEHLVQEALDVLFKNRLVIIIAHRFSTIQNVDKVVVLENGVISDSGSPTELAGRKGLYSELLQYQLAGNKKLLSKYELY